jgi:hypothetical protein
MHDAPPSSLISDLPGAELLAEALDPSRAASVSVSACLLSMARLRLRRGGLSFPPGRASIAEPELTLYRLLQAEEGDAFSRYNALVRRLVSLERALEQRGLKDHRTTGQQDNRTTGQQTARQ